MKPLIILLITFALTTLANAQTLVHTNPYNGAELKTISGKPIPIIVAGNADITMQWPPKAELCHIGWYQAGLTVYPVYVGSEGGWFYLRISRNTGKEYKCYIATDLRPKVILE